MQNLRTFQGDPLVTGRSLEPMLSRLCPGLDHKWGSRKAKLVEVFDIKHVEDHRSSGDRHVFGKHLFVIDLTVIIYTPRSHLYVGWNFFFDKQMCHLGWQRLL